MADMLYLPGGESVAVFGNRDDLLAMLIRERLGSDAERLYYSVCKECRGMADDLQAELDSCDEQIGRYLYALHFARKAFDKIIASPETIGPKLYGTALNAKHKIEMSLIGL